MKAISLFCGAGGMDVGFQKAGIEILWANELDPSANSTYKANHPKTELYEGDIRLAKQTLKHFANGCVDLVFGGPPCQGFSVAGKMDPNDERSKLIWEFFDVIDIIKPRAFVMENVKALGQLSRWANVRELIFRRAEELHYHLFMFILNAADFGAPQKRERVFFIGFNKSDYPVVSESQLEEFISSKRVPRVSLRDCLRKLDRAGTGNNPITCTAKISLAISPVLRRSPYAGMLFNGMGRPMDLNAQANTLPASMGGNKTPIIDDSLLEDQNGEDWIVNYHKKLMVDGSYKKLPEVPSRIRRITIREAAAIQTFPPNYIFCGEKSSVYRQIGNAVPCELARCVAVALVSLLKSINNAADQAS